MQAYGLTSQASQLHFPQDAHLKMMLKTSTNMLARVIEIAVLSYDLEMNEFKGIMPTKIELTLEQSQQGVSNDVLTLKTTSWTSDASTNPSPSIQVSLNRFVSFVTEIHTTSIDFPLVGYIKMEMVMHLFQLKWDFSNPHVMLKLQKTYYKHQDSRIMNSQDIKDKGLLTQTLIYKIFLQRYQVYQGRLLASFQDDAKYEHVGQDTRSQGGKDDQDERIKI
ncbi:hypothetical protein Tco_0368672 [Tanacetum coccineum]